MTSNTSADPLTTFRRRTGHSDREKIPLSWRERIFIILFACHVMLITWALGGMLLWAQKAALVLGLVQFFFLFLPIPDDNGFNVRSSRPGENFRRLVKFPVFWLGLLLMGYITIQALNPAFVFSTNGKTWWLTPIPFNEKLPFSMATDIVPMNAWRMLIILAAPWLLVCSAWVALRRSRAWRILYIILVLHFIFWSVAGLVQHQSASRHILGVFESPTRFFWSTIINVNHAAALTNLGLIIVLSLFLFYFEKAQKKLRKSGAHFIILPVVPFLIFCVVMIRSLGAVMICLFILLIVFLSFTIYSIASRAYKYDPVSIFGFIGIFIATSVIFTFTQLTPSKIEMWKIEFNQARARTSNLSEELRTPLYEASTNMLKDRWVTGWGAGSYRWYFPVYQQEVPELVRAGKRKPMFFQYAHNDLLQYGIELGAIGGGLLVGILLFWFGKALQLWRHLGASGWASILALFVFFFHCTIEFIFYNPAIITVFALLLCGTIRCAQTEKERRV